jgi:hypothetical protein
MHSDIHNPGSGKKERQISFRVDRDSAEELEAWAKQEEISVADLIRKLMRISVKAYRQTGSLHELRKKFGEEASPRDKAKSAKGG